MKQIPNLLTLIRIGLVPLYWDVFFSAVPHHHVYALLIFLMAGATDVLDGYLARKYKLITPMGVVLDPLADKLMLLTVLASFLIGGIISWVTAALLLFRDASMIVIGTFFHFRGKKPVPATVWGKSTTVLYYLSLVAAIGNLPFAPEMLWATVLLSYLTSFVYLFDFRKLNGRRKFEFEPVVPSEEDPVS